MNRAAIFGIVLLCGSLGGIGHFLHAGQSAFEVCPGAEVTVEENAESASYTLILDAERKDGESLSLKLEGRSLEDLHAFMGDVEKRLSHLIHRRGESELTHLNWVLVGGIDKSSFLKEIADQSALWLLINADFKENSSFSGEESVFLFDCKIPSVKEKSLQQFWNEQMTSFALESRLVARAHQLGAAGEVFQHRLFDKPLLFANLESKATDQEKLSLMLLELEFAKQKGVSPKEITHVKQFYIDWLEKQKAELIRKENGPVAKLIRFCQNKVDFEQPLTFVEESLHYLRELDAQKLSLEMSNCLMAMSYQVRLAENAPFAEQNELMALFVKFNEAIEVWKQDRRGKELSSEKADKFLSASESFPLISLCKQVEDETGIPYDDGEPEEDISSIDPFLGLRLHPKEREKIYKLVSSIAEKSWVDLLKEKTTIEKYGEQVNQVHPMRFLGYIFGDPYLKQCMGKIYRSSVPMKWSSFVKGFGGRMEKEASRGNLEKYIPGFSKYVNADPDKIKEFIQARDYEGLVIFLL